MRSIHPENLNCLDAKIMQTAEGWMPIQVNGSEVGGAVTLSLMSIGFLLPNQDDAVVWRGPKKTAMIRQFLEQVLWGSLDILLIDTPPGTSDEHLSILEFLNGYVNKQAVLVTTPQIISLIDVEKELLFCKELGLEISGVIENMSGWMLGVRRLHKCVLKGWWKCVGQKARDLFFGRVAHCAKGCRNV